jgi:hypothetical protein
MKVPMACALVVALASACVPVGNWAQSQSKPEAGQPAPSNTNITKEPCAVISPTDSKSTPELGKRTANLLPLAQGDVEQLKRLLASSQGDRETELLPACGHIVIYAAPRNIDSGMIIEAPEEFMPAAPGLPPCGRDVRTSMKVLQSPVLALPRPGQNDATLVRLKNQRNSK